MIFSNGFWCAATLMLLSSTVIAKTARAQDTSNRLGDSSCEKLTTTNSSQYDEYFDIDKIGNNRTDRNIVNLELLVRVQNMQEELAILLSASNRSRQHPDYEQTYEVRVSNTYTVIYKAALRMFAHHSHTFSFFPGYQFRLHILITRQGDITVTIPVLQKPMILAVHDARTPPEVLYISFGSRMNAYPVTIYFNCGDGDSALPTGPLSSSNNFNEGGDYSHQEKPNNYEQPQSHFNNDHDQSQEQLGQGSVGVSQTDRGMSLDDEVNRTHSLGESDDGEYTERNVENNKEGRCPICPKQEKCEVIVRACSSDTSKELLMGASGTTNEKQKYFFYFNVYLSSKNEKSFKATGQLPP
ncbi:hypothetical protein AND_000332 [Anopheles darlingi]|uniref:Secreted protein n=1 Tax=Anopheles darlingi TaxID=43151 RepID=W5JUL1_ANODA|nr:hypothetical protein AND_000332 [Anopheles darlingi]